MRQTSSHGSEESFISVDPAVARQVTGSSRSRTSQKTSRTSTSAKKPPSAFVAPDIREANTKPTRKDSSSRRDGSSKRSTSLKRVKNSTEILRQRSQKASSEPNNEPPPSSREGRSFTVSNVGSGGMLYLRPAQKQQQMPSQAAPFFFMPLTPPKSAVLPKDDDGQMKDSDARQSIWSDSQTSERVSAPIKRSNTGTTRRPLQARSDRKSGRSYSFSTADHHNRTFTDTQDRTLRIVIDRSAPPNTATAPQNFALPSLSVPIPHFRLGKPVFSTYGTAALRASAYTRTSAISSDTTGATPESENENFIFPAPPTTQSKSRPLSGRRNVEVGLGEKLVVGQQIFGQAEEDSMQADQEPREPREPREPTPASVFDELSQRRDDPSLVRYSKSTGEISAATPARIIAQISSESFMDYELVSDFFLTFRSYLSTNDVLDLLLARLRWAIGRLEDDGRVVRIRTFAALRHWVLNYFMDDFVVNRSLRVRFCQEINSMYHEVETRANGGGSDLKILQDLKRCWNGRCSLYWDSPEFSVDIPHHFDIVPGGILGSRVSNPSVFAKIEVIPQEQPREEPQVRRAAATQSWFGAAPKTRKPSEHRRQASEAAASVASDQSIQPTSCSIPARLGKRSGSTRGRGRSPQPTSVQSRRWKAPSNLALVAPSEYSGNSKPPQPAAPPTHQASPSKPSGDYGPPHIPFELNFIRGLLMPPASALIEVLPSSSAVPRMSTFDLGFSETSFHARDSRSSGKASPAMKGMLGSIRRALSTKPGHGPISPPMPVSALHGRTAALPLTVTKSNDNLRGNTTMQPTGTKLRIDLLCAAVVQSYEQAISAAGPIGLAVSPADDLLRPGRLPSNVTAQSGSILIVDDTGVGMPMMSGALPASQSHNVHFNISDTDFSSSQPAHLEVPRPNLGSHQVQSPTYRSTLLTAEKLSENDSGQLLPSTSLAHDILLPMRTSSLQYNRQNASTASSTTLRRRGSFMSSSGQGKESSINATTMTMSSSCESAEDDEQAKGPPPMLRRRPGGDLRNNENVHDLETTIHHESLDSDITGSSLASMGNTRYSTEQPGTGPRAISMIDTHSSQHLRPSFEAVVAGFSAIPDDDDGGIEATLLKLEGSYEKTSPALSQEEADETLRRITVDYHDLQAEAERKYNRQQHVQEAVPEDVAAMPPLEDLSDDSSKGTGMLERRITATRTPVFVLPDDSASGSHDSYDSTPILQRGTSDRAIKVAKLTASKEPMLPLGLGVCGPALSNPASPGHSFEMVEETDSMKQAGRPQESSARSFYYEEDEMLSDLSSEISVDIINYSDADRAFSPMFAAPGTALSGLELPSHPLAHSPVPSFSLHRLGTPTMGSRAGGPQMPLTPDTSPLQEQMAPDKDSFLDAITAQRDKQHNQEIVRVSSSPGHIPFILACDSVVLAQQFTLVEQAALMEVDWIDLVEMRWDNKSANIHDWVEYVCKQDNKGIDLVITRFNLAVKWTLSEIVMTQDIYERARVLAKFIHIAAHCRRLHNYATMLQITIALTSIDCARLTKSWELVSSPDHSLLKNMEALIQPVRNFHELREEMESSDLTEGCVPFIGLYVHDLTYNAQKPAQIATSQDGEPLINFARYRTAARIIKGLLRLIDASARYEFMPVEGVLERCLWLACFSDVKIREMSKSLEA